MTMNRPLSAKELRNLLDDLADTLRRRGVDAELTIVGGAAMILAYGADRATRDVDGIFWPKADVLDAALEVAHRHNLDPQWLNNGAETWLPNGREIERPRVVADYPAMVAITPREPYLLAMKMLASRSPTDFADAAILSRRAGLTSAADLEAVFREHYRLFAIRGVGGV